MKTVYGERSRTAVFGGGCFWCTETVFHLLTVFFGSHDPTTPNRQGVDVGEQYRSIILYQTEDQKIEAEKKVEKIQESLKDGSRVVTEVLPLMGFYLAEEYHQNYYKTNTSAPYCQLIIEPKIEKVRKRFAELLNDNAKS